MQKAEPEHEESEYDEEDGNSTSNWTTNKCLIKGLMYGQEHIWIVWIALHCDSIAFWINIAHSIEKCEKKLTG